MGRRKRREREGGKRSLHDSGCSSHEKKKKYLRVTSLILETQIIEFNICAKKNFFLLTTRLIMFSTSTYKLYRLNVTIIALQ